MVAPALLTSEDPPVPGGIVGPYRLERAVGEGGMGAVWAARHVEHGEVVAIKLLKRVSPSARRRFAREARTLAAVRHPHVLEVRELLDEDGDAPAIVMELLEGESLAARLEREGALSVAETAAILRRVVSAVGAAHAAGVVHRDLKPENVFLTRLDPPGVKVLDFGVAKSRPPDEGPDSLTSSGALVGTPCYMAPEQVFGERDIDHRADVWALGVVLYQCLSGVLPTRADNLGQVMKVIVSRPIPPLRTRAPGVPATLAVLVDRMLTRDRAERPTDLRPVAAELARHTDVPAPSFGPPARVEPALREVPRTGAHAGAEDTVDPEASSSVVRRPRSGLWMAAGVAGALTVGLAGFAWSRRPVAGAPAPAASVPASASTTEPTLASLPAAPAPTSVATPAGSGSGLAARPSSPAGPSTRPPGAQRTTSSPVSPAPSTQPAFRPSETFE